MKLIFLGPQGSGKSTQAKLIAQKFNLPLIEMGQLLRDRGRDSDSEAFEIKKSLDAGELVGDQIVINTLHKRISREDCQNGYVLDGYPRNMIQLEGLKQDIDIVFHIKVGDDESVKRLVARGREDDSLDLIRRRLEIYHSETGPILAYFREKGILEEIDGEMPIEDAVGEIEGKLKHVKL